MKTILNHISLGLCSLALVSCAGIMQSDKKKADAEQAADTTPSGSRFLQDNSGSADASGRRVTTNTQSDDPLTPAPPPPSSTQPDSTPGNTTAVNPPTTPTSPVPATTPAPPAPPPPTSAPQYPYGKPVPNKKGFVFSPYDEKAGMIDVKDYAPGTKVRDPYTNKIFLVP